MSGRDHHRKPYDEGTQDKLDLYRGYLREWIPVFLNSPNFSTINIFDFFAGPGTDVDGSPGSPVIANEEVCAALKQHGASKQEINLYFNEIAEGKYRDLTAWTAQQSPQNQSVLFHTEQMDFSEVFQKWIKSAQKPQTANLLFLDQNGVKHVTAEVFNAILRLKFTDFLFFISSSIVNRFKEDDSIRRIVPVSDDDLKQMNGTNVHRIITDAYRRIVPPKMDYYIAPFSIKKDANVYGLIFGSHHPLGMDKFLRECWKKDELRGEANFDIDAEGINPSKPSLFSEMNKPQKLTQFEKELSTAISKQQLNTNKDIYLFALNRGFLGKHAHKVIKELIETKQIPKQSLHISYDAWKKEETEPIRYAEKAQP